MPTYRNNRAGALHLDHKLLGEKDGKKTFASTQQMVEPGAEFIADPSEVPESWLKEQGGQPPIVSLVDKSDKKDLKKPSQSPEPTIAKESDLDLPTTADQLPGGNAPTTRSNPDDVKAAEEAAKNQIDQVSKHVPAKPETAAKPSKPAADK